MGASISSTLGAVDSLATSIISIANHSNQQFPFVTIPEYGMLVARGQQLTGAVCTYLMPVITFDERLSWEYYTSGFNPHVRDWVVPTQAMQENYTFYYGPRPQNETWQTSDIIYSYDGDGTIPYNTPRPDRLDIYLPEWHKFPLAMTVDPPANWGTFCFVSFLYFCSHEELLFMQKIPRNIRYVMRFEAQVNISWVLRGNIPENFPF